MKYRKNYQQNAAKIINNLHMSFIFSNFARKFLCTLEGLRTKVFLFT